MALDEQATAESSVLETPFMETSPIAAPIAAPVSARGFAGSDEAISPFAGEALRETSIGETEQLLSEALAELRDETFHEAIAYLAEETERALDERFTDESGVSQEDRERFGEAYLSGVGFEAEQYLTALETGLAGLDIASLTEEQLEEKLDQFNPNTGELTPAGEEFIGGLIRKAKGAVKFVANAAKSVGKLAGKLLGPVLNKLKGLIKPLLRRVLSFAIGRLPAPLQAPARLVASKILSETEDRFEPEDEDHEGAVAPANLSDPETLAEEFDAALAEVFASGYVQTEEEDLAGEDREQDGRQLERLAEARGRLIDALKSGDEEAVGPAIQQFVPALLGALRIGINLVGRSKVVGFLAGFLAKLVSKWVDPNLAKPLSNAIVDTGLRLIMLENEEEQSGAVGEAAPVALASAIEDAVRRFAEQEDYIFENEQLVELAASEAFSQAAATHFPPQYLRPDLRQATDLNGTFVARRPRSIRTYRKYSRVPEIEITPQIADSLPSFGGATVGAALRAGGAALPAKARMHIFQAAPGTTLAAIARTDSSLAVGRGYTPTTSFHPLTPTAAGVLLREPGLGVRTPPAYLRSTNHIAAGQRFYVLQPVGAGQAPESAPRGARAAARRLAPAASRFSLDRRRGRITVRLFFSESEAQQVASKIRGGKGASQLLQAIIHAYRGLDGSAAAAVLREDEQVFEDLVPRAQQRPRAGRPLARPRPAMMRRLRAWILPALAKWVGQNAQLFVQAAAHPESGVTVRIRVTGVPDLAPVAARKRTASGTPAVLISILPGRR
jgi:hypothetical protein